LKVIVKIFNVLQDKVENCTLDVLQVGPPWEVDVVENEAFVRRFLDKLNLEDSSVSNEEVRVTVKGNIEVFITDQSEFGGLISSEVEEGGTFISPIEDRVTEHDQRSHEEMVENFDVYFL
jgi:hypothetical protein